MRSILIHFNFDENKTLTFGTNSLNFSSASVMMSRYKVVQAGRIFEKKKKNNPPNQKQKKNTNMSENHN